MRLSEIQRRRNLPEIAQSVPTQRIVAWAIVGVCIVGGVVLFFRYAGSPAPLLQ